MNTDAIADIIRTQLDAIKGDDGYGAWTLAAPLIDALADHFVANYHTCGDVSFCSCYFNRTEFTRRCGLDA